jgi:hypothetical protein
MAASDSIIITTPKIIINLRLRSTVIMKLYNTVAGQAIHPGCYIIITLIFIF